MNKQTYQIEVLQDWSGSYKTGPDHWTTNILQTGPNGPEIDLTIKRSSYLYVSKNLQLGHGFANSTPTTT